MLELSLTRDHPNKSELLIIRVQMPRVRAHGSSLQATPLVLAHALAHVRGAAVAVAEHSGFINACLKSMLNVTPVKLLTPMLILVAIISHTAADAGYVLVIPIGGVMFYAAGRQSKVAGTLGGPAGRG